jgi:hypothetical protein
MDWLGSINFQKEITLNGMPHGVNHVDTLSAHQSTDEGRIVYAKDTGRVWSGNTTQWNELTTFADLPTNFDTLYYSKLVVDGFFAGQSNGKQTMDWVYVINKPSTFTPAMHGSEAHSVAYLTGVDFSYLSTQGLIGTTASTIAVGNHTHTTYLLKTDFDGYFAGESAGKKEISWANILNQPTSFVPAIHDHTAHSEVYLTGIDFTYLSTENLVGVGAAQVAVGNHVHTAAEITFSDTGSTLTATDVESAVVALDNKITALPAADVMVSTLGAPIDTPTANTFRFDATTDTLWVFNGTAWKSTVLA